jgi:peptidoglycan/LPS O-acetylase OafA/YrhL
VKPGQDVDGLPISRRPIDMEIEGVRGIAAFLVALSHVFYQNLLTPDLHFSPLIGNLEAGHAGVLIFFVLSGYVISWTNSGAYSGKEAQTYLKRRFVRLFPIYFVAMLLTVLVIKISMMPESPLVIVGSFLCLQNFNGYFGPGLNPPRVNNPLWSLNYELVYYALFLLLWKHRPKLFWVFVPALLAGVLCWFAPQFMPPFVASYCCGWVIWASGWWLSRLPKEPSGTWKPAPVATWILLIFANHHINGIARISNALHLYSNDAGMVTIADLGTLPAILLLISAVARRKLPHRKWFAAAAWAVCLIPIGGMILTGRLGAHASWIVGTCAAVLSVLMLWFHSERWLRAFAWFGGISYAFYVVHYPLLYLVRLAPFSGITLAGFAGRLALWVAATLSLSWFLEKRFQPWIKGRLFQGGRLPR